MGGGGGLDHNMNIFSFCDVQRNLHFDHGKVRFTIFLALDNIKILDFDI